MPVLRICQNIRCEKTFTARTTQVGKYCSNVCKNDRPWFVCQNPSCGKSYKPPRSSILRGQATYCSLACFFVMRSVPVAERFWEKVDYCEHGPLCPYCCHEWQAARNRAGYGMIMGNEHGKKRTQLANRLTWELINKRPLGKLFACHHCDNPPCCNPWHLYPGTQSQNIRDRSVRGRDTRQVLLPSDIPLIWTLSRQRKTAREIANHIGRGTKWSIQDVLRYRTWHYVSHRINAT